MLNARLPIVHDLLGRHYSDEEWEALCNGCGKCCYESRHTDTGWVQTGVPCRRLDIIEKRCKVYPHRFEAEKDCIRVNSSVVLSGLLPTECSYLEEVARIVEEDYGGEDPRQPRRRPKKRNGSRKRRQIQEFDHER